VARLLVIGHCTIDTIHLPDGTELTETFGGAAAYAAVGAAIVGADVCLVSVVGADYPLARLADGLSSKGRVDASRVRSVDGRSIRNDAWYGTDGSRRFDVESWSRLELLMPTPADLPALPPAAAVLIAPAPVRQQTQLIEHCARHCAVGLDTELHYVTDTETCLALLALAARVDYFLPSIEHLQRLFGEDSREPLDYAERLAALGARLVAVKQGSAGSTVLDPSRRRAWRIPAVPGVRPLDTTGAGDAYNGGFLAALAGGASPPSAACWGSVAASFVVESVGAAAPESFGSQEAAARFRRLRAEAVELPLDVPPIAKEHA
jgi:sugar/nucleoside kinase (ribokinase family)